jgi:DNA helicase-2/ATP-dependent DNA helicase PcrA
MRGWGGESSHSPVNSRQSTAKSQSSTGSKPSYITPKSVPAKPVEHTPTADFKPSDTTELKAGQKVEHQKFGFGEVLKMEGAAHNPIATIKFELNGEKKIMLNYAKLRIME